MNDFNIADRLREQARLHPQATAIADSRVSGMAWTFAELDQRVDDLAAGLAAMGYEPGQRVLIFVKPSCDFFALIWALFRAGVVPVLIDPAMGMGPVLRAVEEAEPEHMVGIPAALWVSRIARSRFRSVRSRVTTGRWGGGAETLRQVLRRGASQPGEPRRGGDADRNAAILFTSGSTGAPKGVLYTHAIFDGQREALGRALAIAPGEVDLSAFPLFSLFSQALGATAVIPDMNTTRPAAVEPSKIEAAMVRHGVTYAFGSPAFWRRMAQGDGRWQLRRILMAGAPAGVPLLEGLLARLPDDGEVFTPYGATESLPITMPSARQILAGPASASRAGAGTWVGRPLPGVELRVIGIRDDAIASWDEAEILGANEIGELVVRSSVTTQGYFRRPEADATSKIPDDDGRLWHRMGDLGYLDEQGNLWFCGRKKHRVRAASSLLFPVQGEAILNEHPDVFRTAIVGIGRPDAQEVVCFVEMPDGRRPRGAEAQRLEQEILQRAATSPKTSPVSKVLFHRGFPVDARHNAKIRREVLQDEAARRMRR